ncbi:MAG: hypothetical protein LBG79_03970 [Spirochaetaceae bacterium]|jgi:flagellar basal body-associated protein FliL|nr:hypothetical protein [Spirochaetaceae bacterium]
MKNKKNTKPFSLFEKILVLTLAVLFVAIAALSIWALLFRTRPQPAETAAAGQNLTEEGSGIMTFNGIGTLRVELKKNKAGIKQTLVVAPVFLYDSNDRAFSEELAVKLKSLKKTTVDYFASLSGEMEEVFDDAAIKKALLERYNKMLRLGKIEQLYFTDYMILE